VAATGTVGILRALLTADASSFQKTMKSSADAATGFGKSMAGVGTTAQKVTPQLTRLEKSFQGDKLLYTANNLTRAITNIGGASKLTAAEQEKVNRQLTTAIEKYRALGQQAPKAMLELEKATRRTAESTGGLTTKMVAFGSAIGTFVGALAYDAVKRLAGGLADLASRGVALAPVVTAFEQLTAAAGQSGEELLRLTRTATKGLITDLDIMAAANKALLLGLPVTADEFGVLAQAATALGKAMKLDAKQSLDDFITALGRSSPMILDNLGLTVKLGEANAAYKQQLGIVGRELTDNEKKLAFYNAAVDAAKRKTEELGGVQLTVADQFTRAKVAITNLTDAMGIAIARSPVMAELLGGIADEITTAFGTNQVKVVQTFMGLVNDLAISLTDVGVAAIEMGRLTSRVWVFLKDAILGLLETQFRVRAGLRDLIPLESYRQEARELRAMADSLKRDVDEAWQGQLRLEGGLNAASDALGRIRGRMATAATQGTNLAQVADDVAKRTRGLAKETDAAATATRGLTQAQEDWATETEKDPRRALEKIEAFLYSVRAASYDLRKQLQQPWNLPPDIASQQVSSFLRSWQAEFDLTKAVPPDIESQAASIGEDIGKETGRSFVDGFAETVSYGVAQNLADMLIVTHKFKDGFIEIWRSIKQAFANILADMLQTFLQGFLKRMLAALAGQSLASRLATFLGASVGAGSAAAAATGGGLLPNLTTPAITAAAAGIPAKAGFGATVGALATNPLTWAAAGGLLLAWGIGKKGWGRGGEEGVAVNPARDRFLRQFGPPGTGEGSGFHTLASLLTQLTGQGGGGSLFKALTTADTMKEFSSATANIMTLLQRRGVSLPRAPGYQRYPASPLPALTAATAGVSTPAGGQLAPAAVSTSAGAAPVTMNVTIQAWDRADLNTAFRDEIIPRFKDALQFNQAGLRTAVAGV
jgi:hypothetical protein